jgi:hypothetical protein
MTKPTGNPPGAPDPGANRTTHGIVKFEAQVKRRLRRGRSLIDRRSKAGQNACAMKQELIADLGGTEEISAAKLALIEMIARDVYFLDETDRRIFKEIYKVSSTEKALEKMGRIKHPKFIGILYSYRSAVARNLSANLLALGLEKAPPKQKTLQEILDEDEPEEANSEAQR